MNNSLFLFFPFLLQGLVMAFDEFYFHRKRGLPLWERLGHPVDTVALLIPYGIAAFASMNASGPRYAFIGFGLMSCLIITKDEWVHKAKACSWEQWLHSLLFILHPICLAVVYFMAVNSHETHRQFLLVNFFVVLFFLIYQVFYWNIFYQRIKKQNFNGMDDV